MVSDKRSFLMFGASVVGEAAATLGANKLHQQRLVRARGLGRNQLHRSAACLAISSPPVLHAARLHSDCT